MRTHHPTIVLDFIPGSCTGVAQPCDVGIQRPFKLSIKQSYHEDVIQELLQQMNSGSKAKDELTIETRLPILRDRSTGWLLSAFKAINHEALV
jgi:hypothetical protein